MPLTAAPITDNKGYSPMIRLSANVIMSDQNVDHSFGKYFHRIINVSFLPCHHNKIKLLLVLADLGAWVMVDVTDCRGRCTLEQVNFSTIIN